MRVIALALSGLLALAAGPAAFDPAGIAGRYGHHFENGMVDGSHYWSDDVLEIVPLDRRRAYFRARINFYNGHLCAIAGIARAERGGLVYRDPDRAAPGVPCVLRIAATARLVRLDDAGTCRAYCGARGHLDGIEFDANSRRPISYLARLKASPEFRRALAEERTGR